MAEEKTIEDDMEPTNEDIDALRVVLHSVRGISPVSTAAYNSDTFSE